MLKEQVLSTALAGVMMVETALFGGGGTVMEQHSDGTNGFAFRMTEQMLAGKEGENFIMSPYSVWLPLAALLNATDDAAKEELLSALGYAGMDMDAATLNALTQRMTEALLQKERIEQMKEYGREYESPLKIANALFVDENEQVKKEFASVFEKMYDGRLFSVNFADSSAVKAVNDWASEKTDGRIEDIIDSFEPDTVAAIANAIYFSDSWTTEFQKEMTQTDVFHGFAGDEAVPFMNRRFTSMQYYKDDILQAVTLPTQKGGQMFLLLPEKGHTPEELLVQMNPTRLARMQKADDRTVQLSLPKFKLESDTFSVKEAMEALGVPLTDTAYPHLNGLVEGDPLFISEAKQKAMLEVDEGGVTAAAVTVMGLMRMSMPIETDPIALKINRPFALVLTADGGEDGQQVLFTGVVNRITE